MLVKSIAGDTLAVDFVFLDAATLGTILLRRLEVRSSLLLIFRLNEPRMKRRSSNRTALSPIGIRSFTTMICSGMRALLDPRTAFDP